MKFYHRSDFLELAKQWRKKLKTAKFHDIEDNRENLEQHDTRTQLFERREQVLEFFLALDDYLNYAEIPKKHRRVMEMYSSGMYLTDISVSVNMSYAWVKMIVAKYESIVLDGY